MQVMLVRNRQDCAAVFTSDGIHGKVQIEWGALGNPDETDVQEVPDHVANDVNFRRALNRGIFEVVEATEETLGQIAAAGQAWRTRQDAAAAAITSEISHETKNDMIVVPCIGPGLQGSPCGSDVIVREKERYKKPPLCSSHVGLASQYVPTETDDRITEATGGKAPTVWSRAGLTGANQL